MKKSGDDTCGFYERMSLAYGHFVPKKFKLEIETDVTSVVKLSEVIVIA